MKKPLLNLLLIIPLILATAETETDDNRGSGRWEVSAIELLK